MTKISVLKIIESTSVDGPGLRTSVYGAGCENRCPACQNPQSWDIGAGKMMDVNDVFKVIEAEDFCNVTFSGGDPMFQPEAFAALAQLVKQKSDKNIWCYTGYTFENVLRDQRKMTLLRLVDVLVDGPFVESEKDESLLFRGSRNQRLIDVHSSLKEGRVVCLNLDVAPKF